MQIPYYNSFDTDKIQIYVGLQGRDQIESPLKFKILLNVEEIDRIQTAEKFLYYE
jgi:hypothetical protein